MFAKVDKNPDSCESIGINKVNACFNNQHKTALINISLYLSIYVCKRVNVDTPIFIVFFFNNLKKIKNLFILIRHRKYSKGLLYICNKKETR